MEVGGKGNEGFRMTLQFLVSGWMVDLLLRWGQKMSRAKSRVVLNAFSEMPTGHPRPAVD